MKKNMRNQSLWGGAKLAAALLLLLAIFLLGILLALPAAPVQALNPPAPAAALAPSDLAANGTLAAFTALIPELSSIHLPVVVK